MNTSAPSSFRLHLINQACGAANDNVWRFAFLFTIGAMLSDAAAAQWNSLLAIVFILPFVLLAPLAGFLADRVSKVRLVRVVRLVELGLVPLSAWALYYGQQSGESWPMVIAVAALGIQSALFAPVKIAIVPELVSDRQLTAANGQLQAATQAAVIGGMMIAGLLQYGLLTVAVISMVLAIIGYGAARCMPLTPPASSKPIRLRSAWKRIIGHGSLRAAVLVSAGFWMVAASFQLLIEPLASDGLGLHFLGTSTLLVTLVVGIAGGAWLARRWQSAHAPLVPSLWGMLIVIVSALSLSGQWLPMSILWVSSQLVAVGLGAGLWLVPAQTLLQRASDLSERGAVMAVANVVQVVGVIIGAVLMGWAGAGGWMMQAEVVAYLAIAIAAILLLRLRWAPVAWMIEHGARWRYGLQVTGQDHIPAEGGAVIIANHPSYADPMILGSVCDRKLKFIAFAPLISKWRPLASFAEWAGAILIDGSGPRRALRASIDAAVDAAKSGEVVVIFPEGKISRSGGIHAFGAGFQRIAQRAGVPVIPAYIDGMHGSQLSRAEKRAWRWRPQVRVQFGAPLAEGANPAAAHEAVTRLAYESALVRRDNDSRTLGAEVIKRARRAPGHAAVVDELGALSAHKLVLAAQALARSMKNFPAGRVALLLPSGRAGGIGLMACQIAGRTPVLINPLLGAEGVQACMSRTECVGILSATPLKKLLPENTPQIMLDQWKPTLGQIVFGMLRLWTHTLWVPKHDEGAVVFSSGSSGQPKAIVLSQRALLANIDGIQRHCQLTAKDDVIASPLPLFHSFGLTVGCWWPLTQGITMVTQRDPRDGRQLNTSCLQYPPTLILGTPTFMRGWMRRIEDQAFAKLKMAVVGAEACPASLQQQFTERFGVPLLPGYGATELGPFVCCGQPDGNRDGVFELGCAEGSVGRAAPGVAVEIVDPETMESLPRGSEGMLIVYSPARFDWYLDDAERSKKALHGAGYITGDMGRVDDAGFITLTGRLARFAKIGGEMVPLDKVQQAITEVLQGTHDDASVVVVAEADEAKGERLLCVSTQPRESVQAAIAATDLPALFRPKQIIELHEIPLLASGKTDLQQLKQLVAEAA